MKFLKRFGDACSSKRNSFQFTAIDDCTRLRVLKIYERNNQKNACDFVDTVLSRLPFRVQAIQTDPPTGHPALSSAPSSTGTCRT